MSPKRLSRELRLGTGNRLRRRRRMVAFTLASIGSMGVIALYQMGMISHLPEPPLPYLDADEIDAAPEAYAKLKSPDAALGLVSYATTLALIAAGGRDRARTDRWIPVALAGKAAVDALQAAKLSVDQWTRHRAFCSWCLLASAATFATLPLAISEACDVLAHGR